MPASLPAGRDVPRLAGGRSVLCRLPLLVIGVSRKRFAQSEIRDIVRGAIDKPGVVVEQIAYGLFELQRAADTFRRFLDDGHVFFLLVLIYKLDFLDAAQTIGARLMRQEAGATPRGPETHRASLGGVAPASSEVWAAFFGVAVSCVMSCLFLKFGQARW